MNTTEIKPSNFNIDATDSQCAFLSRLAENNRRYRQALVHLKDSCESELKGRGWGLSHQTLNEVQKYQGAVTALTDLIWSIFADAPVDDDEARLKYNEQVKGWIELAMTENPHGMSGQNWFFPIRK